MRPFQRTCYGLTSWCCWNHERSRLGIGYYSGLKTVDGQQARRTRGRRLHARFCTAALGWQKSLRAGIFWSRAPWGATITSIGWPKGTQPWAFLSSPRASTRELTSWW
jgi:hypothetical protein